MIDVTRQPFGADRTGGRNATGAIQAALDAAAKNQRIVPAAKHDGEANFSAVPPVVLPAGHYRIDKPIWVEGDQSLLGFGATLLASDTTLTGEAIIQGRPQRQRIEGLSFARIDGRPQPLSQAITLRGARLPAGHVAIARCHFHGIAGPAIHFSQPTAQLTIRECVFDRCRHALELESAEQALMEACSIDAAPVRDPMSEYVRVRFGRLTIRNCVMRSFGIDEDEHDVEPAHVAVMGQSQGDGVATEAWAAGVTLEDNVITDEAEPFALVNVWTPGTSNDANAEQSEASGTADNPPPSIRIVGNQWTATQPPTEHDPPASAARLMRLPAQLIVRDNVLPAAASAVTWSSLAKIAQQTKGLDEPNTRPLVLSVNSNFGGPDANAVPDELALYVR